MPSALFDVQSPTNSGFNPDDYFSYVMTNIRDPLMTFGWGAMQSFVGEDGNYLGGNTGMGCGWGYGASQGGVMYGYGDFLGILTDDSFGYCALAGLPYYRSGAGAPSLENFSVAYPDGPCGRVQAHWVYPRLALSALLVIGGPVGTSGSFTIDPPDNTPGSGTISGLDFQPDLIMLRWVWGGGFDGNHSLGFGACGPDLSQWCAAVQGGSWRSFNIRSHAFCSTRALDIYYENSPVATLTIDAINADGFDYSWTRSDTAHTTGATWTVYYHAFDFVTDQVAVGTGEQGDSEIETDFHPEGIVYGSGNCPEGWQNSDSYLPLPGTNVPLGMSFGGGVRRQGTQRVSAGGHGGRRYDDGVIRFQSYFPVEPFGDSFARHTITPTGATLDWSGSSNDKKFGYIAWGKSSEEPDANCPGGGVIYRRFIKRV